MSFLNPRLSAAAAFAIATLLLFSACRDPEITTYDTPKKSQPQILIAANTATAAVNMSLMVGAADVPVGSDSLTWTVPASWKAKATGQMRKGSYDANGADMAVFAFPGNTGGLLGNINRWRGQIALAPLWDSELPENTTIIEYANLRFTLVDLTSADGATRVLGAILPSDGETYFFKMTGPSASVASQKQAFLEMLKTVKAR